MKKGITVNEVRHITAIQDREVRQMGPFKQQNPGGEMALRITKAAMQEATTLALLWLTALIAGELKDRCLSEVRHRLKVKRAK